MLVILMIEDVEDDAFMVQRAFQREGIQTRIQVVNDGREGVRYLLGEDGYAERDTFPFPSLVFLDLNMPVMTGFEVLDWLKNHAEYSVLPKMVVSASNREEDINKAYQLGANAYFIKPNSLGNLQRFARVAHNFWTTCSRPSLRNVQPNLAGENS